MGNKNVLIPYKLATSQSMGADFNSTRTNIQYMDRVGIVVNALAGSTATGTFKIQGRVSYSTNEIASAQGPSTEWLDLPNMSQAAPAASTSVGWDIGETGFSEIRVVFTYTAGAGNCDIFVDAKRSG